VIIVLFHGLEHVSNVFLLSLHLVNISQHLVQFWYLLLRAVPTTHRPPLHKTEQLRMASSEVRVPELNGFINLNLGQHTLL
jgi:hypothetical protein